MKKRLAVICALILALTISVSNISFAQGYDPTLSSDELGKVTTQDNEQDPTNPTGSEDSTTVTDSTGAEDPTTTTEDPEPSTEPETTTTVATTAPYNGTNATRIPIITYHRISSAAEKKSRNQRKSSLFLKVSVFEKQMKWLSDHGYRTISTEEFYQWYTNKIKLPPKSVLITFDDGSYSVIKYALPVLKKYHMKGTIFMIGKNTGKTTNTAVHKNKSYSCIGRDVMAQVQATYPDLEFQGHTYNMHRKIGKKPALKKLSYAAQKADFTKMYNDFGYTFLAYPYGKYATKSINAAKASNIKMAFTYGTNAYATKKQNRYKIKRIKISANQPMKKFYRWFKK
ncbi:MAG: polysaccharide deacetylase family protein [Bacillota bacterium]